MALTGHEVCRSAEERVALGPRPGGLRRRALDIAHGLAPTRHQVRHVTRLLVVRPTEDVTPPGGCQSGCQRGRTSTDRYGRLWTETVGVPDVYGPLRTSTDTAHMLCKQEVAGSITASSTNRPAFCSADTRETAPRRVGSVKFRNRETGQITIGQFPLVRCRSGRSVVVTAHSAGNPSLATPPVPYPAIPSGLAPSQSPDDQDSASEAVSASLRPGSEDRR